MTKKAPSNNGKEKDNKAKRKTSRAPRFGDFGFKLKKKVSGKDYKVEIPEGSPVHVHQCEDCKQFFDNAQGLSGHMVHSGAEKAAAAAWERKQPSIGSIKKDCTAALIDKKSKHVPTK